MKHLTIRNLPDDLGRALEEEKQRRGISLNQTVIELLSQRLGLAKPGRRDNGLGKFAGGWSEEDLRELEEATAMFETLDDSLWR